MSTVKANNHQIGQSGTAPQNFTLYQPSTPDGTVRLAVGNSGATTGDVLSVSSTGLSVTGTLTSTGVNTFPAGSASAPSITTTGDTNTGVYFPGADSVAITTGGTAAVTVDSGQRTKFPTTIGVGNATPSTSGAGITFPATQSASTDANTLDDYEEGTWTPNQGSGLTVTGTFSSAGYYTKVGNIVSVQGYVKGATSVSCAVSGVICTNLPFSGISGQFIPGSVIDWNATSNSSCAQQTTTTNLYNGTAITASDRLSFQVTYQVA